MSDPDSSLAHLQEKNAYAGFAQAQARTTFGGERLNAPSDRPPAPGALDLTRSDFAGVFNELVGLCERVEIVGERVLGPLPPEATAQGHQSAAGGIASGQVAALNSLAEQGRLLLARLSAGVTRLEAL